MKCSTLMHSLVVAAALVLAGGAAQAQDKTFKLALQNPKGHPLEMGASKFAELVAAKTGGKVKVNVFPGGTLGGDAPNVSAAQGGTIEFVLLNSGILASQVKDFEVYDFPFMFANAKEADAVVDGPFGQKLHAKLADKGLVGLAYFELGFRNITNSKKPINTVDDIAGLKLRVIPNAINVDWVKALGANPTPLAFPELYAGARAEGRRRPGEPTERDPRQQVLRGAEEPGDHQPPVQPAVADLQQEGVGRADRRREEDRCRTPPTRPRCTSARSIATRPRATSAR